MKTKQIYTISFSLSALLIAFISYLVYFKEASSDQSFSYLPSFNAFFNLISFIFILRAVSFIKKGDKEAHKKNIKIALVSSFFFLISYSIYHFFVGESKFLLEGTIRYIYFFILISHIVFSIITAPLVILMLLFAITEKFSMHRKLSKVSYLLWSYVSLTGVLIYLFNLL